jgi:hypothetical protein
MPGSLLIAAIALALTYGLLRLRSYLVACSKEPQLSYRAYVMWFAETDGYADRDDDIYEDAETDDILGPWPPEIVGHARHFLRDYGYYKDGVWANPGGSDVSAFPLPGRSLAPAHQPDKLRSQTTYHCPTCGQHAWATPTAQLLCGICKHPMQAYL